MTIFFRICFCLLFSGTAYSQYNYLILSGVRYKNILPGKDHSVTVFGNGFSKIDRNGNIPFSRDFLQNPQYTSPPLIRTHDNNYLYLLNIENYALPESDLNLMKMDSTGKMIWSKAYTVLKSIYYKKLIETSDKEIVIGGEAPDRKALLIKTDSAGNIKWSKTYDADPVTGYPNMFRNIRELPDKNLEIIIQNQSCYSLEIGIDSGNIITEKKLGKSSNEVYFTSDSAYLLLWFDSGLGQPAESRTYITKTGVAGNKIWSKSYNGPNIGDDLLFHGREIDGYYYFLGEASSFYTGSNFTHCHPYIMKVDKNGNVVWAKVFDELTDNFVGNISGDVIKRSNDTLLLMYEFTDTHLLKIDTSGKGFCEEMEGRYVTPVLSDENDTSPDLIFQSADISLSLYTGIYGQNNILSTSSFCAPLSLSEWNNQPSYRLYPNPASTSISIQSHIAEKNAYCTMYNALGEVSLRTLLTGRTSYINTELLAPGIYLLKISSDKKPFTATVIINR